MPSAGAGGYEGVWGLSLQWSPGAKPLVRGLGDEVLQKETILNSWKDSFLMNNNIHSVVRIFSGGTKSGNVIDK